MNQVEVSVVSNLEDPFFSQPEFHKAREGIDCRVLVVGALGVNRARNKGLQNSKGELVLLLDDDCVLHNRDYLANLEAWHLRHPEALAIGGSYLVDEEAQALDRAYNCVAKQWQALDLFGDYRSSRLVGGNVSYKRRRLMESGELFDESIKFGGTEAEFHQRLNSKGLQTLFISSLEVLHQTKLTVDSLVQKAMMQARGHVEYKIETGFSDLSCRTYQNKRILFAREQSPTDQEFHETVHWINLYDWAYNYACENPRVSSRKIVAMSKKWSRRNQSKNNQGAVL